ncbi:hypothetical protein K8S19_06410 [bacterium]|nr:hypothetical protein [bacterium]
MIKKGSNPGKEITALEWVEYAGKKILSNDLTHLSVEDFIDAMKRFESIILEQQEKSVLVLSDIRGAKFDRRNVAELKRTSLATTLFIDKYAVVGVTGVQKNLFKAVQMVTKQKGGSTLEAFGTIEDAKKWLVQS